jgi:hypothetical protein
MTEVKFKVESNPLEKSKVMQYIGVAFDNHLEKKIKGATEYSFSINSIREWIKQADDIKKHIEDNLK